MKSFSTILPPECRREAAAGLAFTLTEMMVALAVFSLVVIAMVSLQIFGFKMSALTSNKLKSTAASLKVLDQIRDQVLEAYYASVGNGNGTSFTATGTTGNALQIYPGADMNTYLRFYLMPDHDALYELNSANGQVTLLATNIVNAKPFAAVNFQGKISSSSQEHYGIQMTLDFARLAYTVPGRTYEYSTLEAEMTPRTQ